MKSTSNSRVTALSHSLVDVIEYIRNFTWDDNKFHRGRSLVEIAGLISDVRLEGK